MSHINYDLLYVMLHTQNPIIDMPLTHHVETLLTHKKAKGSDKN